MKRFNPFQWFAQQAAAPMARPHTGDPVAMAVPAVAAAAAPSLVGAVAGVSGVEHAITLLQQEVERNMGMLGITQLADINRECLA